MQEVNRQSSLANRSVNLLDLGGLQRDSMYQETKLVVKFRHGIVALTAFQRQRRVRTAALGALLIVIGIPFLASALFFDAPDWCSELFVGVGLYPGATIMLLAMRPDDHSMIKTVMKIIIGACTIIGLMQLGGIIPVVTQSSFGDGDCIDYRAAAVPCWCSALQVIGVVARALIIIEVGVRRIFVRLWSTQKLDGRHDLIWGGWGRYLAGFAATNTTFVLLIYLFFANGRAFLGSAAGIVSVLFTLETAALAKFAFTDAWRKNVQAWLAGFGTVTDAMSVASLMGDGGGTVEEVMTRAKQKLRYVHLSSMHSSDLDFHLGGGPSHERYAKSVQCSPRDVDIFISHSWRDPPLPKWTALVNRCDKFEIEHNRPARIWIDAFCLDPESASEPRLHPVFLMASEHMLLLVGPTFTSRLWTLMEIFLFSEAGGASIEILPIEEGCALVVDDVDSAACECEMESDRRVMADVIEACGSATHFNRRLREILRDVYVEDESGQKNGDVANAVERRRSRRSSGTIVLTEKLGHLARQFERFNPGCWRVIFHDSWLHLLLSDCVCLLTAGG